MSDPSSVEKKLSIVVIPLIVAVLSAGLTYLLPKLLEKGSLLTIQKETPTKYVDQLGFPDLMITVKGKQVNAVYLYKIKLKNSGSVPLKNIPVDVVFSAASPAFNLVGISHQTNPPYVFGHVDDKTSADGRQLAISYELLNPGDEDVLSILTSQPADVSVYSKSEGMRLREESSDGQQRSPLFFGWISFIAAFSTLLLAAFGRYLDIRRRRAEGLLEPKRKG